MPRTEVYQLRLTKDEKVELAGQAALNGGSIAKLIRDTFGLGDRSRRFASPPYETSQERENKAKVREAVGKGESFEVEVVPGFIQTDSRETAEASLEPLVQQLKGQGMTTPVARREARKRLGL
jgi:hypothetical protein